MESSVLIIIGLATVLLAALGALAYFYILAPRSAVSVRSMMQGNAATVNYGDKSEAAKASVLKEQQLSELNKKLTTRMKKRRLVTEEDRFFMAGLFTVEDRTAFYRIKLFAPIILSVVFGLAGYFLVDLTSGLAAFVLGLLIGAQLPKSYLDRKIKRRAEDIMYFLPLVIEQVIIGVSSSLDTGPCIQRVIQMADERKSHNPVTELLRHAQQFAKSGVSFEESMNEVGTLSGHPELKHCFKSLAQVAKHGGEISKQLQELADSVSSQRETMIEGKIKRLELEATGPVGLVFFGFMIIFLTGIGAQVMKAFQ